MTQKYSRVLIFLNVEPWAGSRKGRQQSAFLWLEKKTFSKGRNSNMQPARHWTMPSVSPSLQLGKLNGLLIAERSQALEIPLQYVTAKPPQISISHCIRVSQSKPGAFWEKHWQNTRFLWLLKAFVQAPVYSHDNCFPFIQVIKKQLCYFTRVTIHLLFHCKSENMQNESTWAWI